MRVGGNGNKFVKIEAGGALSCRPLAGLNPTFFTLSRSAQALLEPQRKAPTLSPGGEGVKKFAEEP